MGRCGRERGGVGLLGRLSAGLRHGSAFRKVNEFAVSDDSAWEGEEFQYVYWLKIGQSKVYSQFAS